MPKNIKNQRGLALVPAVLIILAVTIGVVFYLGNKNSISLNNSDKQIVDCSISGQSGSNQISSEQRKIAFINISSELDRSDYLGEVIARVLNIEPFVVEVKDIKPFSPSIYGDFGINKEFFLDSSEKNYILTLKFGDVISAKLYGFVYPAEELAYGRALVKVKKITGNLDLFNTSPAGPFGNKSGILIRYVPKSTFGNESLIIFNDGGIYYQDDNNNLIRNQSIDKQTANELLTEFTKSNFDNIPSDFSGRSSLSLICNRYQEISLNDSNLPPTKNISSRLDEIISTIRDEATYKLTYQEKFKVKKWEYSSFAPLGPSDIDSRGINSEEVISWLSLVKAKPPENLTIEIGSTLYLENGGIYEVQPSCISALSKFKGLPSGACSYERRGSYVKENWHYKVWPQELGIALKDTSPSGTILDKTEYLAHKDFYNSLLRWKSNLFFLEDDYIYRRLWVSLE